MPGMPTPPPGKPAAPPGVDRTGDALAPGRKHDLAGRNMPVASDRRRGGPLTTSARKLAWALGERWSPEEVEGYLTAIALGDDPNKQPGTPLEPVTWNVRRWAMTQILDRTYGRVKAHVVIEGGTHDRIDVAVATMSLDPRELGEVLPGGELDKYREMQAKVVAEAKRKQAALIAERNLRAGVAASRVIDVDGDDE